MCAVQLLPLWVRAIAATRHLVLLTLRREVLLRELTTEREEYGRDLRIFILGRCGDVLVLAPR